MNPQSRTYRFAFEKIRLVLVKEWDPLSIANEPFAQDEYNNYIPTIFRLLDEGADENKLTKHLEQLTTVSMGLSSRADHNIAVARRLREVFGMI